MQAAREREGYVEREREKERDIHTDREGGWGFTLSWLGCWRCAIWTCIRVSGVRVRERDNRSRALRATRPHTVGYIGGCDQEEGEIECPGRAMALAPTRIFEEEGWNGRRGRGESWDTTQCNRTGLCEVSPVILHGVVSPEGGTCVRDAMMSREAVELERLR